METELNFKATELRLGLPGGDDHQQSAKIIISNKRPLIDDVTTTELEISKEANHAKSETAPPPAKSQIVGWPPIRSYRKNNSFQAKKSTESGIYVKVSMDGAPYLRKIDIKCYEGYVELLKALENMFKFTIGDYSEREGYKGSDCVPTYEDKDGDWMLVGDVPWDMFLTSCKRLRIMKGSDAKGLGCGV
ncbi:hypothetical protein ACFE04_006008 [Oxalis oulophora]